MEQLENLMLIDWMWNEREYGIPIEREDEEDEDGETQTTKVKRQYEHHCLMANGHSYTWAQMALFFQSRRLPIW